MGLTLIYNRIKIWHVLYIRISYLFSSKDIIQDFCYIMKTHLHFMHNRKKVFVKSGGGKVGYSKTAFFPMIFAKCIPT